MCPRKAAPKPPVLLIRHWINIAHALNVKDTRIAKELVKELGLPVFTIKKTVCISVEVLNIWLRNINLEAVSGNFRLLKKQMAETQKAGRLNIKK